MAAAVAASESLSRPREGAPLYTDDKSRYQRRGPEMRPEKRRTDGERQDGGDEEEDGGRGDQSPLDGIPTNEYAVLDKEVRDGCESCCECGGW